jgi:hypothetical protein
MLTSSELQRIYEDAREAVTHGTLHDDHVAGLRAVVEAALAAAPQGEPVAWLREDGTACVTARTKESLIADGGAAATSMKPYCVPCYTHPPRPAAQPTVVVSTCDDYPECERERDRLTRELDEAVRMSIVYAEANAKQAQRVMDLAARLAAAQPSAEPWRDAVEQMLATTEQTASDDPRESINRLIDWHVSVAMDPLVSSDARALIQRGRNDAQPSAEPSLVQAARDALRLLDKYAACDDIAHFPGIVDVPVALRRALVAVEAKRGDRG